MRVLKFGGTSVGSAENLSRVLEIVRSQLGERPVVVVSAHAGVTDELLRLARAAVAGRYSLRKIRRLHREIYAPLGIDFAVVEPLLDELNDLLRGLKLVGELTPRSLDLVASFGERMATRGIAGFFGANGIAAEAVDAWDLGLKTDSRFGEASPDPACFPAIKKALARFADVVPVVTGFVARDAAGNVTTLGRWLPRWPRRSRSGPTSTA